MFEETISKQSSKNLALLGSSKILNNAYLAGGTALALQLGHRISYDLDFFTEKKFKAQIFLRKSIIYFDNAEDENMPKMLKQISWKEVKSFYEQEVKKISQEILR